MAAYGSVLEMIGDTPIIEVKRMDTGPCRLFLKLESQNPGGSIKDRIGKSMIEAAERDGLIAPGGTIIEATAGNTGLGLALVAAQKGYHMVVIVPDKMSQEKIFHLRALGADVRITRSDVGIGHPEYYQDMAKALAGETENSFWVNQFSNPANPLAHETTTGPEIWEQMEHDIDAMVCGVGSGGTITGLGRFFGKTSPKTKMVLADPEGSVLAELVRSGTMTEAGSWLVEGIGEDFVPPNCDLSFASEAIVVTDAQAFETGRELLKREGVLAGSSSGTLIAAALEWCRRQSEPKRVCTFVCDSGNKYLSKMFNDYWMLDQGFVEREHTGTLRDLIARRVEDRAVVTVQPGDSLNTAWGRMRAYEITQLPVLEAGEVKGIIDESDILLAVYDHPERFKSEVSEFMTSRLEVIDAGQPLHGLMPIFRADKVAIVFDGDDFLGLITKTDLINHLRRRMP